MPGEGSGLSLHAGAEHNNVRVNLGNFFVAKAEFADHSAGEIFNDDIRPGSYFQRYLFSPRIIEIQGNPQLSGIPLGKLGGKIRIGCL